MSNTKKIASQVISKLKKEGLLNEEAIKNYNKKKLTESVGEHNMKLLKAAVPYIDLPNTKIELQWKSNVPQEIKNGFDVLQLDLSSLLHYNKDVLRGLIYEVLKANEDLDYEFGI
jgi:hypothetical protein